MKKLLSAALVTALMLGLLTGCGSVKSAWVAARFGTALKGNPITKTAGILNAQAVGKTLGIDSQAGVELQFSTVSDADGEKTYSDIHSQVNMLGMKVPQDFQVYGLPEGEKTLCYVHLSQPDLWAKSTVDWKMGSSRLLDPGFLMMAAEQAAGSSALTEEEDGDYRLNMVFQLTELEKLAQTAGGSFSESLKTLDLSQVTVPLELVIDGESFLPEAMTLEVQGLSGDLLESLYGLTGQRLKGTELERGSLTLKITEFGFGPKTVPELPQQAVTEAARMEEIMGYLRKVLPED